MMGIHDRVNIFLRDTLSDDRFNDLIFKFVAVTIR